MDEKLKIGGFYNWKYTPNDKLIYLGKKGSWHQFKKIGDPRDVWCEVLDTELLLIEETKQMVEIIDSYLISQEFASLIANEDSSGLSEEDLCDFTHWEGNIVEDNEYLVLSDNDETIWYACDVTGFWGDCIRVNKWRME